MSFSAQCQFPIHSDFESKYAGKSICLIGGKLQGVEAAYLAKKAGISVILIDKNPSALAQNICDEFHCFDITKDKSRFISISENSDFMIPVNENEETIAFLESVSGEIKCPLLFDFDAYRISSDKSKSKEYFKKIGVPTPADKPDEPPYFVKPPSESGSIGARIIHSDDELKTVPANFLIEEYLEGPVISLEIIGNGKDYTVVKETYIHIDDVWDCFMVTPLPRDEIYQKIAFDLASGLNLKGIMDVEAISSQKGWKVLEIDARFPSQTPICVYFSSGVNLLLLLIEAFTNPDFKEKGLSVSTNPKYENAYCIFEHFQKKGNELISGGEHLISAGSSFRPFAADSASSGIEIFECAGHDGYRAYTVITYAKTEAETKEKREKAMSLILNQK
ncbi:3-methylornithine--L-lysine ligase PylC [Methanimicrococcus blatticola]|uniref:Pyrrolysine biosynthesis protein PylC n=1 Tax=Methanimicrococcus blatticola TaxID=91560 RepID=A0A484F4P6_9EURY|nr:3-methylornithine--L-lysine ligase PylC [Methanimicrococcus blatticola]MBZ3936178.1 3-methylornithine--L-lysine ligase PylC [Methanimicrococcus blatticola]MCC2508421.1 3-methylornithine--L-lysine ligase PylC [Methanimicrococcus blatticola]TDQ70126.1 pyrrolysine biosynthesis protein PylC [Methanimicrococcus blatticola]